MENYIVSARKYRPATFDTVVGQSALTTTLKNAISSGHLAHAYLFSGPRGVGKTTCARIFAKTINCLSPNADGEACNECESCKAFNEQRSFNIHELDAASNNSVDDIRQLIDQVRIPPQVGKYKVFIIDEVHMLSSSAFNAFLKTLEEPPHHAIFILATTEKHKLLPTILSRCQIYDFNRMNVDDIVSHLQGVAQKEGITAETAALNVIAQKADGGMRDALSIFDQVASFCGGNITYQGTIANLNVLDYDYYFKLTDYFLGNKITEVMVTLNEILCKGFDAQHFINGLASHLRNLLVSRDAQTVALIEASDEVRQRYQQQAQKCKPAFLYAAIRLCTECDINYKQSQSKRLLVEITLIEIAQTAQEDVPSSGRRPKKILKPLFKQQTGEVQQQKVQKPQPVAASSPVAGTKPQAVPPVAAPKFQNGAVRLGSVSIRNMMSGTKPESINPSQTTANVVPEQIKSEDCKPIDSTSLLLAWRDFASSLPIDDTAMANRLKDITPVQVDDSCFEVTANNEIVEKELNQFKPRILQSLRLVLHNSKLEMNVRVRSQEDRKRVYNKMEMLSIMCKENQALSRLREVFGLQLD
jgi:DNA polymerase-3 subunit gamma/tau